MKDFSQALEKEAQPSDILAVSEESSLEYVEGVLNIIWFSDCGIGFPVAQKLLEEGNNVVIGYVQDLEKPEDPEVKRRRLSLYDGILVKEDIEKVLKQMAKIENKDDWIVMCDFNSLAPWAERALALGFTKGFFPLEEDLELEKDRDSAKDIVREYYPDLAIAEVHEFKTVHDGIKFLEENC